MKPVALSCLCLLVIACLFGGCEPRSAWVGKYEVQPDREEPAAVTLTLQADGKGYWATDQESVPLRWEERQGALWLHVRSGGVLVARPVISGKTVAVELPGRDPIVFAKTQN